MSETLLRIEGLRVRLSLDGRVADVVDGIDLQVRAGSTLAVVGESGCGKSLTALAILRLLPRPVAQVAAGRVLWKGRDLVTLPLDALRKVRGREIAMIFQEPMTSLNPVYSCGEQIAEVLRTHLRMGRSESNARAVDLLDEVQIDDPSMRAKQAPHELSGGMRQRVMIAMAVAAEPALLLADEPTTALDVTVQHEVLELLDTLRRRRGMGMMLITHDLALVSGRADEVAVMYAGRVVERGPTDALFARPAHPYTLGLLACRPRLEQRSDRLDSIGGQVPDAFERPGGCAFHPRCPFATDRCREETPESVAITADRHVACFESQTVLASGEWSS